MGEAKKGKSSLKDCFRLQIISANSFVRTVSATYQRRLHAWEETMWTKIKETTDSENGSMGAPDSGVTRCRFKKLYHVQGEEKIWEIWQII